MKGTKPSWADSPGSRHSTLNISAPLRPGVFALNGDASAHPKVVTLLSILGFRPLTDQEPFRVFGVFRGSPVRFLPPFPSLPPLKTPFCVICVLCG